MVRNLFLFPNLGRTLGHTANSFRDETELGVEEKKQSWVHAADI